MCMFNGIRTIENGCGDYFLETYQDVVPVLMGASIIGYTFDDMAARWTISASNISAMYESRLKTRKGIA